MIGTLRRYARMFKMFALTELQFEMEYRLNFLFVFVEMCLVVGTSVVAVLVMFSHTETLNGWTLAQMLVLLGVFYLVQGSTSLLFEPSLQKLMEHIRQGTLDYHLLKPANPQFVLSTRHLRLIRTPDVLLGFGVLTVGLVNVGGAVSVLEAVLFAISLVCGLVLVYSLLLALVTLSFWFVRVDNVLTIFWAFTDAGRFPVSIYPAWLRWTLSTVVPIGIAVTVPAQAISGMTGIGGIALVTLAAALAFSAASAFWRFGLKSYTGASA